ncbi:Ribonuclease P protein subunit p40 [Xylographa pallens]|nr:Ribonuclease P protein subunit p40 [Xylographa pallens]
MLSEGRAGIDNLYFLKDGKYLLKAKTLIVHGEMLNFLFCRVGQLRLELPREIYERVGLVGHPIRDTGRKHLKTRYAIEINLRLPSMVHGKKGFERIVWAFKNVLNNSVTWLFYDFNTKLDSTVSHSFKIRNLEGRPIDRHHPITKACPMTMKHSEVITPPIAPHTRTEDTPKDAEDDDLGRLEWLDLVALESPRILPNDRVDPFLCQYEVPDSGRARPTKVTILSWRGFMPAEWIKKLYLECYRSLKRQDSWGVQKQGLGWIALSASAFKMEAVDGPEGYVLLTIPSGRTEDSEHEPASHDAGTLSTPSPMEYTLWEMTSGHGRS